MTSIKERKLRAVQLRALRLYVRPVASMSSGGRLLSVVRFQFDLNLDKLTVKIKPHLIIYFKYKVEKNHYSLTWIVHLSQYLQKNTSFDDHDVSLLK